MIMLYTYYYNNLYQTIMYVDGHADEKCNIIILYSAMGEEIRKETRDACLSYIYIILYKKYCDIYSEEFFNTAAAFMMLSEYIMIK